MKEEVWPGSSSGTGSQRRQQPWGKGRACRLLGKGSSAAACVGEISTLVWRSMAQRGKKSSNLLSFSFKRVTCGPYSSWTHVLTTYVVEQYIRGASLKEMKRKRREECGGFVVGMDAWLYVDTTGTSMSSWWKPAENHKPLENRGC